MKITYEIKKEEPVRAEVGDILSISEQLFQICFRKTVDVDPLPSFTVFLVNLSSGGVRNGNKTFLSIDDLMTYYCSNLVNVKLIKSGDVTLTIREKVKS